MTIDPDKKSTRSRLGCATCKRRRKKCDEVFGADGSCERCRKAHFECVLTLSPDARPAKRLRTIPGLKSAEQQPDNYALDFLSMLSTSDGAASRTASPGPTPHVNQASDPIASTSTATHPLFSFLPTLTEESLFATVSPNSQNNNTNTLQDLPQWLTDPALNPFYDLNLSQLDSFSFCMPKFDVYAHMTDSWLSSLPENAREKLKTRILGISTSVPSARAARNAVCSLYAYLLTHEASNQKTAADRRLSFLRWDKDAEGLRATKSLEVLVTDGITNQPQNEEPFGPAQANRLFREALQQFDDPTVKLETRIWTLLDLGLFSLAQHGAAPSYDILSLGRPLLQAAFGSSKPTLDLSSYSEDDSNSNNNFAIVMWCLADIGRAICKKTDTFFHLPCPSDSAHLRRYAANQTHEQYLSAFLTLPIELACCLAASSNLAAKMQNEPLTKYKAEADGILGSIIAFEPDVQMLLTSAGDLSLPFQSAELWRCAALIHHFQVVERLGPLHHKFKKIVHDFLATLKFIKPITPFLTCPLFLCGTVAFSSADRDVIRTALESSGPERFLLDDAEVLRALWAEMDNTGYALDWHDFIADKGLSVAFF